MSTMDWVRDRAIHYGWTWSRSADDALEVSITRPGAGEVVVKFSAGGSIRSARTSDGEITGAAKRDQLVAFLRSRGVSRG